MGRKAKFTQEQVFAVADAMAAEGRDISPAELLSRLGGGSFTTLYRHLDAWRRGQAENAPAVVVAMPPAVRQALDQAWQVATSEAFREVTRVREELAHEVAQAQRQFTEALAAIGVLEREADQDAGRIETFEVEVMQLREAIAASHAHQGGVETRLAEREARLAECSAELAKAMMTVESQRTALSAAAGREGELREENARLAGRCEQLSLEIERNMQQLAEREARERTALTEIAQLQAASASTRVSHTTAAKRPRPSKKPA